MKNLNTTIPINKEIKSKIEKNYKKKYENWNSWFIRVINLMDKETKKEIK